MVIQRVVFPDDEVGAGAVGASPSRHGLSAERSCKPMRSFNFFFSGVSSSEPSDTREPQVWSDTTESDEVWCEVAEPERAAGAYSPVRAASGRAGGAAVTVIRGRCEMCFGLRAECMRTAQNCLFTL